MSGMVPYDRNSWLVRPFAPFDMLDDLLAPAATAATKVIGFKMDVEDAGDKYVIAAELPGVNREQIDVELNEGRLSISVDKKETEEHKAKNWLQKETAEWSATRGVYLKDAATEGLSAKLEGGVLTINVPKQTAKANVTKVSID